MSRFLANNFEEFAVNVYASHLLRTCIECCTGIRLKSKDRSKQTAGYDELDTYKLTGKV